MHDDELKKKAAELMSKYASQKKQEEAVHNSREEQMRQLQAKVPALLSEWEAALRKCVDAMNEAAAAQGNSYDKFELNISRPSRGSNSSGVMGLRFGEYEFSLTYSFASSASGIEHCSSLNSQARLHGTDINDRIRAKYRFNPELHAGKAVLTDASAGDKLTIVDPFAFWMAQAEKALERSR